MASPDELLSADGIRDFNEYLANCTDLQVLGVLEKEKDAGRDASAELARTEARHRGLGIWEE